MAPRTAAAAATTPPTLPSQRHACRAEPPRALAQTARARAGGWAAWRQPYAAVASLAARAGTPSPAAALAMVLEGPLHQHRPVGRAVSAQLGASKNAALHVQAGTVASRAAVRRQRPLLHAPGGTPSG